MTRQGLMAMRMGDYTKGRDHARVLSRVDEVQQFFGLPRLLLRDHPGNHHRATYDIQDEENGTTYSLYTLVYSQVKQFLTEL